MAGREGTILLDLKKYVPPKKEGILFRLLLTLTSTFTRCAISLFRDLNKVSLFCWPTGSFYKESGKVEDEQSTFMIPDFFQ